MDYTNLTSYQVKVNKIMHVIYLDPAKKIAKLTNKMFKHVRQLRLELESAFTVIAEVVWNTYFLFAIAMFVIAPVIFGVAFVFAGYSLSIQIMGLVPGVIFFTVGILVNVFLVILGTQDNLYDSVTSGILKILYGKGDSR